MTTSKCVVLIALLATMACGSPIEAPPYQVETGTSIGGENVELVVSAQRS